MSGFNLLKEAYQITKDIAYGLIGWLFLAPITAAIPKRRDWIAVIGRGDGKFLDNTKYFFIESTLIEAPALRIVNITERADTLAWVQEHGLEAMQFPSLSSWWFLARCGTVVVDSIEWCERWRCFLLCRARKIQLWHGVGFKRIELDKWHNEARGRKFMSSPLVLQARLLRKRLRGRIPRYAAVVTTSAFYRDEVFTSAFRQRYVLTTGYPRNGFGRLPGMARELALRNVDMQVLEQLDTWQTQRRRIVLVAPTFRDTRATPLCLDRERLAQLDAFCDEHGFEFLFKFHPYEKGSSDIHGRHLWVLSTESDVYPLFPFLSGMVSDYSSIYMDFLLLDRPILFLTPDLEQYVARDRDIQFDFESMTPGPKFSDWDALLEGLVKPEAEQWQQRRAELRLKAFDNIDQRSATRRLLEFFGEQGWVMK